MFWNDFNNFIYSYRLYPKPEDVIHVLTFIKTERLLWHDKTAIAISGVVTALCDRHPVNVDSWKKHNMELMLQAYAIARSSKSQRNPLWAEYLINRWLILGTDECAWELLLLCHSYSSHKSLRDSAQRGCDAICRTIDGKPSYDSKGNLTGTTKFEDMRLQMLRLAREYSRLAPNDRVRPFSQIPFDAETKQVQQSQHAGRRVVEQPDRVSLLLDGLNRPCDPIEAVPSHQQSPMIQ